MTEDEMMADLAAADSAGDTALAQHIAGKIKALRGPQPSKGDAFSAGMTRGIGDRLVARMSALQAQGATQPTESRSMAEQLLQPTPPNRPTDEARFEADRAKILQDRRQAGATAGAANPVSYLAGQVAPALATALVPGGAEAKAGGTLLRLLGAARSGAAYGGVQGLAGSESDNPADVLMGGVEGAAKGAGIGAALGGAAVGVGKAIPVVANALGRGSRAVDPVAEQIARLRSAAGQAAPPAESTVMSKTLELLMPSKLKLAYKLMKRLAGDGETAVSGTAYPKGEPYVPVQRALAQAPEVAQEVNPALSNAAERSRAAVLERVKTPDPAPRIPEEQFTPVPRRLPPTPQPAPPPDPKLAAIAEARRASILEAARQTDSVVPSPAPVSAPAPAASATAAPSEAPATMGNAFESAMRASKVSNLTKAVEANAVAHLGADTMSPQFAEAISNMPEEWWHGVAQVAKVNKPSRATIDEVTKFFSDRAAQATTASARRVAGQ